MTPAEKHRKLYATRFVFRRLGSIAASLVVLWVLYTLRGVLVPLLLAFLLAYALDPIVSRLVKLRVPRAVAAVLVTVLLGVLALLVLVIAVPYFASEIAAAASELPDLLLSLRARIEERFQVRLPHSVAELERSYGQIIRERAPGVLQSIAPAIFGTLNYVVVAAGALIIPLFSVYLLTDFDKIVVKAELLIPRRWAPLVTEVAREVHEALGNYIRGQVLACLLLSALYAVGLSLLGVRLAVPIGIMTGMLAFVPYIGFSCGLALALIMTLLNWQGFGQLVGVLVVMFGVQVIDGVFITPKIVGGSVGLRPIEVLIAMMAMGTLFGFLGVLLAVPLGAVLKIVIVRATDAYLASQFYRYVPAPTTPTPYPISTPLPDVAAPSTDLPASAGRPSTES